MEAIKAEVQRRVLIEGKNRLESAYGVHINSGALTVACNIVIRYFDVTEDEEDRENCLQKQVNKLLEKACFKLRYEIGTSQEEKELDMAEYSLNRAIVEIMELRKERNPICKPWHSRVKAEIQSLMKKLDEFMRVRNPNMPLLQKESCKNMLSLLKESHQNIASVSSLFQLDELVAMIPEAFKGDLTVTSSLIAEVAKPLTGVPSPLLLHSLRMPIPGLKEKLDEKCLGDEFAVVQIVNVLLSRPKQAEPGRPIGAFLFLGADDHVIERHGVHLAEALAETLFEDENLLIELDMCTTTR
ncbi:chaperone protein ClpB1-like protein [Corchorus capsularis]|uniref:Chaperone protein ClpB1-like protein n=1 Tax=Corchorus capsularis TaxID=210143 RepID=A0A1R3GER7_COCAP|nr:chaperone protein ClpB1-like protein [Corchorus capsularis]